MKKIEIVVPCYNEEECITLIYEKVYQVFQNIEGYDFSFLFVNDGSADNTLKQIKLLANEKGNEKIRYISFARNFGKESAIYAGLSASSGEYVVLMDADLQHPPCLLVDMIAEMEQGYDCCAARRISRKGEPFIRSVFSNLFYKLINKVTAMELRSGETDYRMMTRQVVEAIVSLNERERFIKGIYSWVGFNTKWIEYENVERAAGHTTWSFMGLINYAVSGFIAFATTPLRSVIYLGMLVVVVAFIYALVILFGALCGGGERNGYASIVIILLFLGGVIITILGIIGEYLARIYYEVKGRPICIVKESNIKEV